MNVDTQFLSLTMKTSKNSKNLEDLLPHEILLVDYNYIIPSDHQPNNGNIYIT